MANETDFASVLQALSGGNTTTGQVTPTGSNTFLGASPNAWSSILGQIAGAIAPGSSGAALGAAGAQMGQANILSQQQQAEKQALLKFLAAQAGGQQATTGAPATAAQLDALTPAGMDTVGLKIDPTTGAWTINAAPKVSTATATEPTAPTVSQPTGTGGQNGTNVPFPQTPGMNFSAFLQNK